jgi:hypothetical protein
MPDQVLDALLNLFVGGNGARTQRIEHVRERGRGVDARLGRHVRAARDEAVLRRTSVLHPIEVECTLRLRRTRREKGSRKRRADEQQQNPELSPKGQ